MTEIPEEEWQKLQELATRIERRSHEQEGDLCNLNNLMHALHGEGVRSREYTPDGEPSVFINGVWVKR
jgi:hypothetical protein